LAKEEPTRAGMELRTTATWHTYERPHSARSSRIYISKLSFSSAKSDALELHAHKGSRFYTSRQIERQGKVYVPAKLTEGLAQAVRFPPSSAEFGSAKKLTGSMAEFFCNFGKTSREDAALLTAFALSTWFVDCFQRAPCLHLTGSGARVSLVMRLLACVCRHPLLLGRLDLSALHTLPKGLDSTLLIYEDKLSKNVARLLEISRNRELVIPFGKSCIHAYGARVLFSDSVIDTFALQIHLPPTTGALTELKDDAEKTIAPDFQAKLLRYRLIHFATVQHSHFDCTGFVPDMHDDVRALLSPLIDCGHFGESILSSLQSRSKERAGSRFTDLDCLVIESALAFCHDSSAEEFFVKDITDTANAMLQGRNEDLTIKAKAVGQALRRLGLFPVRVTDGYHLVLTNRIREKIHRSAEEHNVPSVDEGTRRCDHCRPSNPLAN
jgi:hypothetical protein